VEPWLYTALLKSSQRPRRDILRDGQRCGYLQISALLPGELGQRPVGVHFQFEWF